MKILILTLVLLFPISVWADSFTATSTAEQDAVLAKMLTKVNAERAAKDPPLAAVTVQQMVQRIMLNAFKSYVRQDRDKEHGTLKDAWRGATQTERDQIKTILGIP